MKDNGFEAPVVQSAGGVQVEETRAAAEVKAQVFMAKQYPRDAVKAIDRILAECDRPTLAEKAVYSFPKGGSQVTGASIRLAEAVARGWGNIAFGMVEVDRHEGESLMLAYAWDLETNTMSRKEFRVKHIRDTKEGGKALRDERDVYELTANQGSRRVRSCILSIIPGDVVDMALDRCQQALKAKVGNIDEAIPKVVAKFSDLGVTKSMLEKRLRHRIEATTAAEIVQLRTIFNSLKDEMSAISDWFEQDGSTITEQTEAAKKEFDALLIQTHEGKSLFAEDERKAFREKAGKIVLADITSYQRLKAVVDEMKAKVAERKGGIDAALARGKGKDDGEDSLI